MPLTEDDIREILRIIDESELDELSIETDGFSLHVRKGPAAGEGSGSADAPAADALPRTPAAAVTRAGGAVVRILRVVLIERVGSLDMALPARMPVRNALRRGLRERAERRYPDHGRCQDSLHLCHHLHSVSHPDHWRHRVCF